MSRRTQLVEVHINNTDGSLVPGMYASVQITPSTPPKSLRVPGTVLIVDSNGTRVGVVTKENKVHLQPVVVGRDFGKEVEILSGLKGREKLVNNPSDLLQDGDTVQISTAAPPSVTGKAGADDSSPGGAPGGKGKSGGKKRGAGKPPAAGGA